MSNYRVTELYSRFFLKNVSVRYVFLAAFVIAVICAFLVSPFSSITARTESAQKLALRTDLHESRTESLQGDENEVRMAIRSGSKDLVRIRVNNESERRQAESLGLVINDYGSSIVIAKDKGVEVGPLGLESQDLETSINTAGGSFNPIIAPPNGTIRAESVLGGEESGYYIVQFGTTPSDELLKQITDAGLEVLQYVPHQAYFVYGTEKAAHRVAQQSRVRWVGEFLPEYKLSAVLRDQVNSARTGSAVRPGISSLEMSAAGTAIFDISVFKREDSGELAAALTSRYGAKQPRLIELPNNFFNVIRVEMPVAGL